MDTSDTIGIVVCSSSSVVATIHIVYYILYICIAACSHRSIASCIGSFRSVRQKRHSKRDQ